MVVLKIGGSLGGKHKEGLVQALHHLRSRGEQVVVVHGGGPAISKALSENGVEPVFRGGQRMTTPEAMPIVEAVLSLSINPRIVAELHQEGLSAAGVSGADDIVFGEPIVKGMSTAGVKRIDITPIAHILDHGRIPVLSPIGTDGRRGRLNINADAVAGAIAGALSASRLVFLTDVNGIYRNWDAQEMIWHATGDELGGLRRDGIFIEGMIPKVEAVLAAIEAGVSSVYVVHGGKPEHVLWSVNHAFSNGKQRAAGQMLGTCVTREAV